MIEQGKVCIMQNTNRANNALWQEEVVEMPEVIYKVDLPAFTGRNVPIKEIASAIGKDAQYVRLGLQQGILKFGTAIKVGSSNEFSYYCPDKRVWEETGYFNDKAG